MRGMLTRLIVLMIIAAGCSRSGTPATVPASIPDSTTVTTTVPPTTSTSATTTTAAPTTTLDRRSEIEAIFQDLEERRLQALYEGDREAFRALFANDEYMRRSMALFDLVEFLDDWRYPQVSVIRVLADDPTCIAAVIEADQSVVSPEGGVATGVEVVELEGNSWGMSYAGEGWECDGPHPLSP